MLCINPKEEVEYHSRSSQNQRRRKQSLWLLAGPLFGGLLTHCFDIAILNRYTSTAYTYETSYAAEIAPQLLRHKKTVQLTVDPSWETDTDDGVGKSDSEEYFLLNKHGNGPYDRHTSPDDGDCIAMHAWQEDAFPVCNSAHEMDFFNKYRPDGDVAHITHGGFNDLFQYTERFLNGTNNDKATSQSLAVKILKWEKPYSELKFGVVRQDALTLERLTKSSHIYPIYGYCGFNLVVPFMTGGGLADVLSEWKYGERELSLMTRLKYAVDIAAGLRDLHDIDGSGVPSATHGDLKEQQYLFADDGSLMLGDFNKGQFITKSSFSGKSCTYKPPSTGYNDKTFRSPEEYAQADQTAATDVYALGSLMYYILTGERSWNDHSDKKKRKKIQQGIVDGKKPHISSKLLKSRDPINIALIKAYEMCTVYDPNKRATAKQVADYLDGVWKELNRD